MKQNLAALLIALALLPVFPACAAADTAAAVKAETLSLEEIAARVQSGSPLCRAYDELIAAADAINRQTAYNKLVEANNELTDAVWALLQAGDSGTAMALQTKQEQLRQQIENYKPENYARDYAKQVEPVKALRDQLIAGAEGLYLSAVELEQDIARGALGLETLEQTLRDTLLLQSLGRASARACEEAEAARDAAQRQLERLREKREGLTAQLQFLLGETQAGTLTLAPVPEVTGAQLAALAYDADLEQGLANNYDLNLAKIAADEAKEDWKDEKAGYLKKAAEHHYNAAVYTCAAEEQKFRQAFDALYRDLNAAHNAVAAAQETLTDQQKAYTAAELQYELGKISRSALLNAGSELALAQLGVETAKLDLADAYHSYCWAKQGLLPAQA